VASLRRFAYASGAALAGAGLAFALFSAHPLRAEKRAGKQHVVHIAGMLFKPATLEISAGDSVTWINDDIYLHAVKSTDPNHAWQSKDLKPQDSWTKVFEQGDAYLCPYHPTMTGKIIVGKSGASGRGSGSALTEPLFAVRAAERRGGPPEICP
jgi:plastocyanin